MLINAYNAFTLRLMLDHYPLKSIRDIPKAKRWAARRWRVAGNTWSLNDIEHEQVRAKFAEPRIHFALVCASVGCPPLRNEAFTAEKLDAQLQDQTRYVHTHARWFRFDEARNTLHLTRLYDWYGGDFEQAAGSVTAFVSRHAPSVMSAVGAGKKLKIKWLKYDWSINERSEAP